MVGVAHARMFHVAHWLPWRTRECSTWRIISMFHVEHFCRFHGRGMFHVEQFSKASPANKSAKIADYLGVL